MRKIAVAVGAVLVAVLAAGCELEAEPTPVQPAEEGKGGDKGRKAAPIKLSAKRTSAKKSMLSDGGALSCVKVTVTNQTKKNLSVNPLYFSLTDTGGTKHDASSALGEYEGQIDTTTLAPGEKATGVVCGKGRFAPKVIAMTNPLFSEAARAQVA